jgi:hypothetical protein
VTDHATDANYLWTHGFAAWQEELAKVDPDMHRRLVDGNWTVHQCKHCGRPIGGDGGPGWVHLDGPQRRMHRCAVEPYGFDAAPAGEPCSFACLGSGPGNPEPDRIVLVP